MIMQQGSGEPTQTNSGQPTLNGDEAQTSQRVVSAGEELVFYRYYEGSTRAGVRHDNGSFGSGFYMALPKSIEGIVIDPAREVHGFSEEFTRLVEALKVSHAVTLIGPPGSGKNMIASLYCYKHGPSADRSMYDYIVPVQLGQDWDIGRVAHAVMRRLRPDVAAPTTQEEALTVLLQCLRYKRFLLVLDQFEVVIDPYQDRIHNSAYEMLLNQALTGGTGGSRLLLLARQDFVLEVKGYGRFSDFVELPRMKSTDAEILLNAVAPPGVRLDHAECDNIVQKAAGNPLLMRALVSQLAEYPKAGLEEVIDHGGWRAPLYYRYEEMRAALPLAEREALELISVAEEDDWWLGEGDLLNLTREAAFVAGKSRPQGSLFHTRVDGREIKAALLGLRHRLLIGDNMKEIRISPPLAHFMRISMKRRDRQLYHLVLAHMYDPANHKTEDIEFWFKDNLDMVRHLIKADQLGAACEVMCRKQMQDYAISHQLLWAGRYVEIGSKILFAQMGDGQPTPEPTPPWRALLAFRLGNVLAQNEKRKGRAKAMYEEARYWLEHSNSNSEPNRDLYRQVMKAIGGVNYLHRSVTGGQIPMQRDAPTISGRLSELRPPSQSKGIIRRRSKL